MRSNSASRALPAVTRIAGITAAAVVDPPEPGANGWLLSPSSIVTCGTSRPSVSATTIAMIVRLPVPMSCVPQRITTLPSEVISQCARAPVPAPPQRFAEQPRPRLIGPGVGSPVT